MRTSRFTILLGLAVLLLVLGTFALAPNAKRTRVPMPDGSTVTVLDGFCFVQDNWIAFGLFGGAGAFCIAAVLYKFIRWRKHI